MYYQNFTPNQKVLIKSIVNKVSHSGCSSDEIVQVLCELCGSLLGSSALTGEDLVEYLDKTFLPEVRRVSIEWNDLKLLKEQFNDK